MSPVSTGPVPALLARLPGDGSSAVVTEGDTSLARAGDVPVWWCALGAGRYDAVVGDTAPGPDWQRLDPGDLIVLDPCGPTLWRNSR